MVEHSDNDAESDTVVCKSEGLPVGLPVAVGLPLPSVGVRDPRGGIGGG